MRRIHSKKNSNIPKSIFEGFRLLIHSRTVIVESNKVFAGDGGHLRGELDGLAELLRSFNVLLTNTISRKTNTSIGNLLLL